MPTVEFFFDPSCPWTWVTSRWLATVARERDLDIRWRTWSLPMRNEGRELPDTIPAHIKAHILEGRAFSTGALRVLEAAGTDHGPDAIGRLYTELGRRAHGPGGGSFDGVIPDGLAAAALPAGLSQAAGDPSWDKGIRDNMAELSPLIGDEVGVPVVCLVDGDSRRAMAGPILAEVPPIERALALWDAVATVVTDPAVYELKRHRAGGGPNPPALDRDGRVTAG